MVKYRGSPCHACDAYSRADVVEAHISFDNLGQQGLKGATGCSRYPKTAMGGLESERWWRGSNPGPPCWYNPTLYYGVTSIVAQVLLQQLSWGPHHNKTSQSHHQETFHFADWHVSGWAITFLYANIQIKNNFRTCARSHVGKYSTFITKAMYSTPKLNLKSARITPAFDAIMRPSL